MKWLKQSGMQTIGFTIVHGEMLQIALYQLENAGTPQLLGKEEFLFKTTPLQDRKKLVQAFLSRAGRRVQFKHLITRDRVFTKQFQFPSSNPEEIRQMLELRLPREMPFGIDQIVYHSHPIDDPAHAEFHTSVLVFGISKEAINEERELLRSFGILPQQILLSTVALSAHSQKKLGVSSGPGRIIIFGFSGKGEVLVSNSRGIQFSRTFHYETSDMAHSLQDSLQSILDSADFQEDLSSYDLCVSGDFENLKDQLFPGLHIHRHSIHPPSQSLTPIDFLMFAAANACSAGFEEFNLLPPEIKAKLASVKTQSQFTRLQMVWVALLFVFFLISLTGSVRAMVALASVNQKLETLEPSLRQIKEVSRSVQTLYKINSKKVEPLDLLVRIHEKAGESISLSEFEYDEKEGLVHLKGRTDAQDMVNQYVKALGGIEWFKQVDLQYSESTSDGVRSQFQFAINAILAGNSKNET